MEIKIPEIGESVRDALLARWFKKSGDRVSKDEPLCEIETDKITLDINADAAGILSIQVSEGTTVAIGSVVGTIAEQAPEASAASTVTVKQLSSPAQNEEVGTTPASSPSVRREMREQGIAPGSVTGTGRRGRIMLDDLSAASEGQPRRLTGMEAGSEKPHTAPGTYTAAIPPPQPVLAAASPSGAASPVSTVRSEEAPAYSTNRELRKPMSPIRRRIAERLVTALQQTAMLTTFNEADLSRVKELRVRFREQFQRRHGAGLGLMPFFVKACVEALKEFPVVNACIDGQDIVYHDYYDIGIAIGAEKGLVVPILRDADRMHMYEIDQAIAAFSEKIKTNQLAISDLEGGTFSISNGGVYGSMLSTPILNPPQSGVLGIHAIQDRPVARDGKVVIRPMMYLALSYDHRIIDGREAVSFLKKVKEYIEEPEELLLEG